MPASVVTYSFAHSRTEQEKFCFSLEEAVAFADSVIEDGGHAFVSTEETSDITSFTYSLCDIHSL